MLNFDFYDAEDERRFSEGQLRYDAQEIALDLATLENTLDRCCYSITGFERKLTDIKRVSFRKMCHVICQANSNVSSVQKKKYVTKWNMMLGMTRSILKGATLSPKQETWLSTNYVGGAEALKFHIRLNPEALEAIFELYVFICLEMIDTASLRGLEEFMLKRKHIEWCVNV